MNQQKNGKKRWRFLPLRFTLYALIYATFFGIMGLNNWQLWTLSRTSGVTILTFTVLLTVMLSVYGGYDIGKRKSRPVISSLVLAVGMTDIITYLQLEIMNANEAKYGGLILFGWDFALLFLAMALQVLVIVLMTRVGNSLYFSVHPPESSCIIANSREAAEHVAVKLSRYKLQYAVRDMVNFNARDVKKCILRNDAVFFADVPAEQRIKLLEFCYENQKNVYTTADLYDVMVANGRQVILDDCPFVAMGRGGLEPHEQMVKRIMDIVISSIAILLFSPFMLLASVAILLEDGRPAFFLQKRKTIDGNVFDIVKFRTMRKETANGPQVSVKQGDGRITRIGAILRKFRLDEMPQFFNILKGDMSVVGPRPEMLENVAQYSREFPAFVYRQKMKAGLTGYAQIEGRYNTTAKDKLMMDLMYIENYSIWMDVKLLFRTLTVFFKADSTQGFEMHTEENDAPAKASGDIRREEDAESTEFDSPGSISSTYHSAG